MDVARELFRFLRAHWLVLVLSPALVIGVTALHEAAHAVAVLVQGGAVTGFEIVPSAGRWGSVDYEFPRGASYSSFAIAIAPYASWMASAIATSIAAFLGTARSRAIGASMFVLGYVVPLGDIANTALPFLLGADNDFRVAFGAPTIAATVVVTGLCVAATVVGYWLQRSLYTEIALAPASYVVGTSVCFAGIATSWLLL